MQITDMEQFKAYNKLVTQSKSFRLGIRGKTRLHLGALPVVTVDYNKAINLTGLNSFQGIEVRDIKIALSPGPDGSNMQGTLVLPNPTVMTINMGDLVQDILLNGEVIGNATIENIVLKPGENLFPMRSYADQLTVITYLQNNKSKGGVLPVEARARTVTYKGKRLEYFEYALGQTPIKLDLPLKDALSALGLDLFGTGSGTGGGHGSSSAGPSASSSSGSATVSPVPATAVPPPASATPTTTKAAEEP